MRATSKDAHYTALRTVSGQTGCAGVVVILLATGAGLLLDFQLTGLHPLFSVGLVLLSLPVSFYGVIRRVMSSQKIDTDYVRNLALASVAGQAGCVSVLLIFMGLFGGMFLDARLNTHPIFTIGLVLVAVPVSLYAMVRLMLSSVSAIKQKSFEKESGS